MMRKMILFFSIALLFAGCSKEENTAIDYNKYITAADEYVMFQNVVNENLKWIYRLKMHPEVEDGNSYRRVYVTKDTTIGDSAVYTLDYG
ncbi:MAG: membrane lipoprotein lipid attachment site-containing protein, partial [Bacteroidales bacterium]|nr:membrane lipoprotein lipid attachment site-containing protein [Bacteroidales bacterium]